MATLDELYLYEARLDDYITALQWSATTEKLYAATGGGTLYILEAESAEKVHKINAHTLGILSMTVSPDGTKIATTGQDNKVQIRDTQNGVLLHSSEKYRHWPEQVVWSPSGECFAVCCGRFFILFDSEGQEITRSDEHASTLAFLAWSPDGNYLATASYGGVRLYDITNPGMYELLPWKNSIITLSWSPCQRFIFTGTQDKSIHVWDLKSPDKKDMAMQGYPTKVRNFAWDTSGKNVATNCAELIVVWNIEGKNGPEGKKPLVVEAHDDKVTCLAIQPKEGLMVSADQAGRIFFWVKMRQDYQLLAAGNIRENVTSLEWNKDGSLLAAGTDQGKVVVFNY